MPSLTETAELISELHQGRIEFSAEWCTRTRHHRSACRKCLDACPQAALSWENDTLNLDANACTGCGACSSACPTQALWLRTPTLPRLYERLKNAASAPSITICCERVQKAHDTDDASTIVLPCLAALEVAMLVFATCAGAHHLVLVDAKCATCENALTEKALIKTGEEAKKLCDIWGLDLALERRSQDAACDGLPQGGVARRHLFHELAQEAKETALGTAASIYQQRTNAKQNTSMASLLKEADGIKKRAVPRNARLLDCLFEQEAQKKGWWDTPLFGTVELDASSCKHCGLCAFLCPTGALTFVGQRAKPAHMGVAQTTKSIGHLEFRPSDCVNCGLCEEICPSSALTVWPGAAVETLFDLEPVHLGAGA